MPPALPSLSALRQRAQDAFGTAAALYRVGLLDPRFGLATGRAYLQWGTSIATGFTGAALRRPDQTAIVDDAGRTSFAELDARSDAVAEGLVAAGIGPGSGVGVMCRNHRGFVEAVVGVAKAGGDILLLNTGFAGPQLAEVLEREGASAVIHDQEFGPLVEKAGGDRARWVAWHEGPSATPTLEELAAEYAGLRPEPPERNGRFVILTSGTTGTPKGAPRDAESGGTALGLLERLPMRVDEVAAVPAPAFHGWGFAQVAMGGVFGWTLLLPRRFDPEDTLRTIAEHGATVLAVVPVMMQRILQLGPEVIGRYDTSSLRMVASSGSALPGELALRWMDTFGDHLYNFYGSTEASYASIADPADLRAAPGTAGRVPRGGTVKILDDQGREVPTGTVGRIFVGNDSQIEGYTGGGDKERISGLMSIGDLGHFDLEGRLFVGGRDDDMIVSGGENVFPSEVENLLVDHPEVADVAVIGVPDEEFGQALRAFVVLRPGSALGSDAVRGHVRSHLARYKVPRRVDFLDEIPRNPSGKVLKRLLRERT
ncbi:MAG: AMP-binding protein [Myxococcota bacterium]|nr:AMP-binding protein [Myxococcota bacterium]